MSKGKNMSCLCQDNNPTSCHGARIDVHGRSHIVHVCPSRTKLEDSHAVLELSNRLIWYYTVPTSAQMIIVMLMCRLFVNKHKSLYSVKIKRGKSEDLLQKNINLSTENLGFLSSSVTSFPPKYVLIPICIPLK
jgi:hypothetical protein